MNINAVSENENISLFKSSRSELFYEKGILDNFVKFTEKNSNNGLLF